MWHASNLSDQLRQQLERRNVTRSNKAKMPAVESCKLWFPQTLGNRQYGSVNQANICIGVLVAYFANATIIVTLQVFDVVGTGVDIIEQGDQNSGVEPLV